MAFGPQRRILWAGKLRVGQIAGTRWRQDLLRGESSLARRSGIRRPQCKGKPRHPLNALVQGRRRRRNSATRQLWVATNSARHWQTASAQPLRNAQRVSGRIGGMLSGQADHFGLGDNGHQNLIAQSGTACQIEFWLIHFSTEPSDEAAEL